MKHLKNAASYAEILAFRICPGLINLLSLSLVIERLDEQEYIQYSVVVAFASLIGVSVFGILTHSLVPLFPKMRSEGRENLYLQTVLSLALAISLALIFVIILTSTIGYVEVVWGVVALAIGGYTFLIEIPHSQQKFRFYGCVSLFQAVALLALTLVVQNSTVTNYLLVFSISYLIAIFVLLVFLDRPKKFAIDWNVLKDCFSIGVPYTAGYILELSIAATIKMLAINYYPQTQASNFAVFADIAQRIFGFLGSVVSFISAPKFFFRKHKQQNTETNSAFYAPGLLYAIFSLLMLSAIFFLAQYSNFGMADKISIEKAAFALVVVAVVLNRVKKIVLDPILIASGHTLIIAVGYAGSLMVVLASIVIARNYGYTFELSQLFLGSTLFGIILIILSVFWFNTMSKPH